jgi:hypothetical protein
MLVSLTELFVTTPVVQSFERDDDISEKYPLNCIYIRLFQYRNLDKSNLNKSEIICPSSQMGKLKNIMPMEKAPVAFPKHICSSY